MNTIDTRIVQMEFQHGQFISGVSQTMRALDLLKKALNFTGVVNVDDLKFNTAAIENGVDKISGKFLELRTIGENVFGLIEDKAIDAGKKITDAFFGFSDISAGQSKYETRTKAVQTIMNATGKSLKEVEEVLNDLQHYTDETSYDFAAMVDNIGKFTAVGVDLALAEKAMEGIGNEAAKSGASIQQANHAMYNFAQALSQGAVKLQDWKSISNATMATKEFKEMLISTAIEMGTLKSVGKNVGSIVSVNETKLAAGQKALAKAQKATKDRAEKVAEAQKKIAAATKETEVNFKSFEQTLSTGWLTSDVLIETLNKYSNMDTDFGREAFYAAQKALTFTDAIQAVKDSVSSGWMESFGYIFGNLEEAISLWTNVANSLIDFTSIFSSWRNEVLGAWHEMGGYNDMIEAASNLWQVFMNIVQGVGAALSEVFPFLQAENMTAILRDGTRQIKEFSEGLLKTFGLYKEISEEEKDTADEVEEVTEKTIELVEETGKVKLNFVNITEELKRGMRGDNVKKLQKQINDLGITSEKLAEDGIFGPKTQAGVIELQRLLGVPETGMFDAATKAAIETDEALEKLQNRAKKGLSLGSKGDDVKKLQRDLNAYLDESEKLVVDGIMGPKTEAALKKLQEKIGVEQTGAWDDATQAAVKSGKIMLLNIKKIDKLLKKGDRGNSVRELQEEINKYLPDTDRIIADGIYGPKTEEAIKKIQSSLGIKETGLWDRSTIDAIVRQRNAIYKESQTIKEAKKNIEELDEATKENEKSTNRTTTTMMRLKNIAKGFASIVKIVGGFAGAISEIAGNILGMFTPLIEVVYRFGSVFGIMFDNLAKEFDENDIYGALVKNVTNAFGPFGEFIQKVSDALSDFLDGYDAFLEATGKKNTFESLFEYLDSYIERLGSIGQVLKFIIGIVKGAFGKLGNFASFLALFFGLREPIEGTNEKFLTLANTIDYFINIVKQSGVLDSLVYAFDTIKEALSNAGLSFDSIKQKFEDAFGDNLFATIMTNLGLSLLDFLETAGFVVEVFSEIVAYIIENLPEAISTLKDFWSALTFEGDEKTGKAPGIIGRVTKFLKDILGLIDDKDDAIQYAKSGVGPISLVTGALAEESLEGEQHVNKSLKIVKGFCGLIKKIFSLIRLAFTGEAGENSGLKQETIDRISSIRDTIISIFDSISYLLTGRETDKITKNFKEKANNIRDTVNNVFDFISNTFGGIFARVAYFVGGISFKDLNLSDEVKKRIDGIKECLKKIGNAISVLISGKISDRGGLSRETAEKLIKWRDRLFGIFIRISEAIKPFIGNPLSVLKLLFGGKRSDRGPLSSELADKILSFRDKIVSIIGTVKEAFSDIFGTIKNLIGSGNVLDAADAIEDSFENSDFKGKLIKAGLMIGGALFGLKYITGKLQEFKSAIGVGEEKKEKKGLEKIAASLLKMAISVGIITAAILVLGKILHPTELTRGLVGLGIIAGIVVGVFALLKKIASSGKENKNNDFSIIKNIGKSIMDLATGMGILTGALFVLAKMKTKTFLSGLWKLGIMLSVTVGFLALLKLIKFDKLNIKGFWDLAAGIEILAIVVHTLSDMKWDKMGTGLAGLAGIMVLMAGLMWVMGKVGATKIKFKGFVEFGECVAIIGRTMKSLGKMSWPELGKALIGLLAIIGSISGIIALLGHFGDKFKPTTLLLLFGGIAAAIGVFGYTIKKIKGTDPSLLYSFSISLSIALGAFIAACMFVGGGTDNKRAKAMLKGAASIAGALGIFVAAAVIIVGGLGELDRIEGLDLRGSIKRGKTILELTAGALRSFGDKLGISLPIIAGVLAASLITGIIPGGPSSMVEGAGAIAAAIGEIVAGAVIVVGGIGKFDDILSLNLAESAKNGGEILASVAESLSKFGENLGINLPIIAGVLVASLITGLIPGGGAALIAGAGAVSAAIGVIMSALTALVTGLGALNQWTDGGLADAIDSGGDVLESISTAIARVKSGFTKVYNEDLKEFGEAMKSIREGIEGASDDSTLDEDMAAATGIAEKLHTFFNSLTPYNLTDASGYVTDYTSTATQLLGDVSLFGTAISDLWNGVTGISQDKNVDTDVSDAIKLIKSLKTDFFDIIGNSDTMPSGSGLVAYNEKISGILDNVKTFGENIGIFHDNIGGLSESQIEADAQVAIGIAETVSGFLADLNTKAGDIETNKGAIEKWFTGDTKQETVFDSIARLGQSINGSKDAFSGLTDSSIVTDVGAAVDVAIATAGLLSYLGKGDVYNNITSGAVGLEALGSMFNDSDYSLATIIQTFADQLKHIDNLPQVSDIFAGFSALASILSENAKIKDDFSKAGVTFSNHILTAFTNNDVSSSNEVPKKIIAELKKNEHMQSFRDVGKNYIVGITEGVIFNTYMAEKAAAYAATLMKRAVERELEINSPSKVGEELGKYFVEGLAVGSSKNANEAEESAREAAAGMVNTVGNILANIDTLLSDGFNAEPVITPVVDLSNVTSAAEEASKSFGNGGIKFNATSTSLAAAASRQRESTKTAEVNDTSNVNKFANSIDKINEKLQSVANEIGNMKIYLNGDVLTGYMTPKIDRNLGANTMLAGRMN